MKVSMNQIGSQRGKPIDRGVRGTRDIEPAKAKPITRCRFERRFFGVLIALIFATVVIVSVVLAHLSSRLVERLDGLVAIDSANGAGQERPRTLQRTAVTAWRHAGDASEDAGQMMLVGKAARQCHLG